MNIDPFLPYDWKNIPDLQRRATIVRILDAPDVEDIVRFHLTGSGWKSYQETQMVCGHRLPEGLKDGSLLPFPIYTPTTKALVGHDEHISADSVAVSHGHKRERLSLQAACVIANHARSRGIIMADTKFEFSGDVLADEKGTPDSSRFWDADAWKKAMEKGKLPPSFDKQFVREWGKTVGIDKRDPKNPDDVAWVHEQTVPAEVCDMTTQIYRYIFWRLTGMKIERYQRDRLSVEANDQRQVIEVIIGSESDRRQIEIGLRLLINADVRVSVISCHRNPAELEHFAQTELPHATRIIAGAGMAAQLPGVLKAHMCRFGNHHIPVIGVAFEGQDEDHNRSAKGSIKDLPGQPVELDENGEAYFGEQGFAQACVAALEHEFLPKKFEPKPPKIGTWTE